MSKVKVIITLKRKQIDFGSILVLKYFISTNLIIDMLTYSKFQVE